MPISQEEKRRIIDLHFNQSKTIREVCRIMGKSSHDITPVTKEHRIRLAQEIPTIITAYDIMYPAGDSTVLS